MNAGDSVGLDENLECQEAYFNVVEIGALVCFCYGLRMCALVNWLTSNSHLLCNACCICWPLARLPIK